MAGYTRALFHGTTLYNKKIAELLECIRAFFSLVEKIISFKRTTTISMFACNWKRPPGSLNLVTQYYKQSCCISSPSNARNWIALCLTLHTVIPACTHHVRPSAPRHLLSDNLLVESSWHPGLVRLIMYQHKRSRWTEDRTMGSSASMGGVPKVNTISLVTNPHM